QIDIDHPKNRRSMRHISKLQRTWTTLEIAVNSVVTSHYQFYINMANLLPLTAQHSTLPMLTCKTGGPTRK
ncbi:hypothetical protein, partial [Thiolapillus sp.]|uniref:hypothetical protein n=2 Tax=Thiolapillus sp. TaxID=2017437 RepID=UPI003AF498F0